MTCTKVKTLRKNMAHLTVYTKGILVNSHKKSIAEDKF